MYNLRGLFLYLVLLNSGRSFAYTKAQLRDLDRFIAGVCIFMATVGTAMGIAAGKVCCDAPYAYDELIDTTFVCPDWLNATRFEGQSSSCPGFAPLLGAALSSGFCGASGFALGVLVYRITHQYDCSSSHWRKQERSELSTGLKVGK